MAMVAFLCRVPILQSAARAWIVHEESPRSYDAVIVPGGGLQTRPFAAAELYHENRAEKIVSFLTEVMPSEAMGLTRPSDQVTLEILDRLGVPEESVHIIGDHVTSSWDEVLAVRDWALEAEVDSILVVTEIFPSRRTAWIYDEVFEDSGIATAVHAITPESYSTDNWWSNERGLIAFQNELIKYFYYRIKYRGGRDV